MNRHLSSEEFSRWVIGEYDSELEQHIAGCSTCRAELDRFKLSLSLFHESARNWADCQCPSDRQTISRIRQAPYRSLCHAVSLAALSAIVCLFTVFSLRQHPAVPTGAEPATDDAVLLKTIDRQLSETLPTSLAPLGSAVAWENTRSATTGMSR